MLPSYESPLRFQEGWSSLQTHSRTPRNPPRGLTLQMGMLGNLKARTALRMCSKNLQLAPNCGTWVRATGCGENTLECGVGGRSDSVGLRRLFHHRARSGDGLGESLSRRSAGPEDADLFGPQGSGD